MKFKEYINEANQTWIVEIPAQTVGKQNLDRQTLEVTARSVREALTRAGKQLGLSKREALVQLETKNIKKA